MIARETAVFGRPGGLSRAAAEGLFRVMAYKDEYEVARLHAAAAYGDRPVFHLAPPLIARIDPATGRPRKMAMPGWLALPLFRVLRHGKVLRGTRFDPFGWQAERRQERALIAAVRGGSACRAGGVAAGHAGHGGGAGGAARHDPRLRAGEGGEPRARPKRGARCCWRGSQRRPRAMALAAE